MEFLQSIGSMNPVIEYHGIPLVNGSINPVMEYHGIPSVIASINPIMEFLQPQGV